MKAGDAMNNSDFVPFTVVAAVAFGAALIWVMTQWLKADAAASSVEREVQRKLDQLDAAEVRTFAQPPAHAAATPATPADEAAAAAALEKEETALARLLLGWGTAGTVVGMVAGAVMASFVGALLGAVAGSVLATIGVVVAVALKAPAREAAVVAPAPAEPAAPADHEPHPPPRLGGGHLHASA